MTKELCFITVLGKDRKGIVARVSNTLYKDDVNIEDVEMKVMEGYFVMNMFVDLEGSKTTIDELRKQMDEIEEEMGMKIQIQHEKILRSMHRL